MLGISGCLSVIEEIFKNTPSILPKSVFKTQFQNDEHQCRAVQSGLCIITPFVTLFGNVHV